MQPGEVRREPVSIDSDGKDRVCSAGTEDSCVSRPRCHSGRGELSTALVRAGSAAIAGHQTAIYPLEVPGGWHLIGSTELRPFRAEASPPCVFAPGDVVRFVAVEG